MGHPHPKSARWACRPFQKLSRRLGKPWGSAGQRWRPRREGRSTRSTRTNAAPAGRGETHSYGSPLHLTLDGFTTNMWLRELGYAEEPSSFARVVMGVGASGIMQAHQPLHGASNAYRRAELLSARWPCFLLNSVCEVEATNEAARRLTGIGAPGGATTQPGVHLLDFMLGNECRERMKNWEEVAASVLPTALQPFLLGKAPEKPPTALADRIRALRAQNRTALRALSEAWDAAADRPVPHRIAVPIEWLTDTGEVAHFHCFLSTWNGFDRYWGIDWHPANAVAWVIAN